MANPIYTAIDIGSHSIKVVSLRRVGTKYKILGAGKATLPKFKLKSGESHSDIIAKILKNIVKSQKIPIGTVVSGVSGRSNLTRYMSVPIVPPWKLAMLMSYEVEEHRATSGEIAFDYQILDLPEFEEGHFSVMLVQAQEASVNKIIDICKGSVRKIDKIDTSSLAIHNLYNVSDDFDEEEITLTIDIGASDTAISMQQGEALFFSKSIAFGGDKFTKAISENLGISIEAAEELKVTKGKIFLSHEKKSPYKRIRQMSVACKASAAALASAIQSSIIFFRNQLLHSHGGKSLIRLPVEKERVFRPERVLIAGGGANLEGLADYLEENLKIPCQTMELSLLQENLVGSAELTLTEDHFSSFATTLGLAVGLARVDGTFLNLMTSAETDRREFWNHTFFAISTGVVGLLIVLASVINSYLALDNEKKVSTDQKKDVDNALSIMKRNIDLKNTNIRLFNMLSALKVRTHSGTSLLDALSLLQEKANKSLFFINISTELPSIYDIKNKPKSTIRRRGRRKIPVNKKETDENDNIHPPKKTKLIMDGFCLAKDKTKASKIITEYAELLENHKSKTFTAVKQEYGKWIDDREIIKKYFMVNGNVLPQYRNVHSAFRFRLECWIGVSK